MTGSAARAQDVFPPAPDPPTVAQPLPPADPPTVAQPSPPAYPPTVAQPPPVYAPRPPRPPGPSGFERRHHVGGQIGGTGFIQAVYRLRVAGPFHMEVGALGADHGANFSTGVVIGSPVANRWFPYVGLGGGFMVGGMPPPKMGCDPAQTTCPEKTGTDFRFVHARVGIGFAFGTTRRNLLSLDVGGWYGRRYDDWNDTAHNTYSTSKAVLQPMAGLSYFFAIH